MTHAVNIEYQNLGSPPIKNTRDLKYCKMFGDSLSHSNFYFNTFIIIFGRIILEILYILEQANVCICYNRLMCVYVITG
jgi:hypothetical protein